MIPITLTNQLKQLDWQILYKALQAKKQLDNPQAQQVYIYARGYRDFQFFFETFFDDFCSLPFSRMHEEFFEDEADPERRGRREVIAAPRSHAKTTIKMLAKAVHAIVYGYEPFIVILGYGREHAEDKVQQILDRLKDPRLVAVYGQLAPTGPIKTRKRARGGKGMFITENNVKVLARSRGQELRGVSHGPDRPSLIICDDVENLDEAQSPEMRAKVKDWFFKTVLKVGQIDGSTNIIFIGTCLHQESLLSELLENPAWYSRKYQAIERFSERSDLWDQWTQLYTDLSNPNRILAADSFYAEHEADMLKGAQVLWPEGDPYHKLMKQWVSEGQAAFYSEKQNDPYDPERQLFNMEKAKRFEVVYDGHTPKAVRWLDGSNKLISWHQLVHLIAYHDPALGEKPGQKGTVDYAAIVVVAKDQDGYLYALDCYLEKTSPSRQIEAALALHRKWQLDGLYLEANHFQGLLKPLYFEAQKDLPSGEQLRVIPVQQHHNKIERITSMLEPVITYGQLLFSNTLPKQLIQQLNLFPTTHDDGPDALQGAVSQLRKRNSNDNVCHAMPITTGNVAETHQLLQDLEAAGLKAPKPDSEERKPATPNYPEPITTGRDGEYRTSFGNRYY